MINKSTAAHTIWGAGCDSWTLTDQERLHVMQEAIPADSCEKRHLHSTVDQLYFVLSGVAIVRFDGRDEVLGSGDAVEVPAGAPHQLRNDSDKPLELLVISSSAPRADRVDLE